MRLLILLSALLLTACTTAPREVPPHRQPLPHRTEMLVAPVLVVAIEGMSQNMALRYPARLSRHPAWALERANWRAQG